MTKVEMEKRITEMEQELSNLKAQLNKPEKKTGWEKVGPCRQPYFYINCFDYSVEERRSAIQLTNGNVSEKLWNVGNHFTSKELAENIARYQSLDLRIRRRIAEICEPVNWNTYCNKYSIFYNHAMKKLDWFESWNGEYAIWYCDTTEHAIQIIEEFKDELTWYFTEFKDRMDSLPGPDYN